MKFFLVFAPLVVFALARPGQDQLQRGQIAIIEYEGDNAASNLRGSPTSGGSVEYTKSFHLHEAPEENSRADATPQETKTKKHYQVIFVKTPSNTESAARTALTQHEQKTIVYVLSKKNEALNANFEVPAPITSKPDVFYVKYKNQADSDHVVSKIQESFKDGGEGYNSPSAFAKLIGAQGNAGYNKRKYKI